MLSPELQARLEKLLGAPIKNVVPRQGGYTPALRLVCRTARGSFFCKVGVTPFTTESLHREIRNYNRLHGEFMPQVVAWEDSEHEPILLLQDLSAYDWAPVWTPDRVERVRAQIEAMHNTRAVLETFSELNGSPGSNWEMVAADPAPFLALGLADAAWLETALPRLIETERRCPVDGTSLTHCDIRSDNICTGPTRALLVDWNLACLSNPKLDLGFWLPSLAFEGGPLPESMLPDAPDVAAWVSGFFAARAGLPGIPDAPFVRKVQWEQLTTALPWAIRALDLPPLA